MLKLTILDRADGVRVPAAVDGPGVYVWRDLGGRPCAYGQTVDGHHWMHWPHLASYRFDDEGGDVVAYTSDSASPDSIIDTFHRMVLPLALQRRGLEALHASAVTIAGRVVAFCAVSGTGKSTLAYALHRARGYPQWSDDAVVFEVGSAITAVPLPFDVRLLPEAAAAFTGSSPRPAAVLPRGLEPAPLGAICVLARRGRREFGDVSVDRLPSAKALTAVLEHAHCFSLTDLPRKTLMMEHYLDVAERVPVMEVRFKPGLDRLPAVVEGVSRALEP
ncbi:MAG TPA: hypothetical protein VJ813_15140 [Vicinamibacterales bacterium]|nr:hypothetical protein [Vicinamibacterales bacterium]